MFSECNEQCYITGVNDSSGANIITYIHHKKRKATYIPIFPRAKPNTNSDIIDKCHFLLGLRIYRTPEDLSSFFVERAFFERSKSIGGFWGYFSVSVVRAALTNQNPSSNWARCTCAHRFFAVEPAFVFDNIIARKLLACLFVAVSTKTRRTAKVEKERERERSDEALSQRAEEKQESTDAAAQRSGASSSKATTSTVACPAVLIGCDHH